MKISAWHLKNPQVKASPGVTSCWANSYPLCWEDLILLYLGGLLLWWGVMGEFRRICVFRYSTLHSMWHMVGAARAAKA